MDNEEIAFIICVNNSCYYEECIRYISDLFVPEGYHVDIICIQEADSMAMGYQAGMNASKAKYKVYLHQDTFIVNRNFICDIVRIFKRNDKIGMMGMIGSRHLPKDAVCYQAWNIGMVMAYDGYSMIDGRMAQNPGCEYIEVEAVDGLLLATQYDIPWREDILDGWDFYDVSQSLEMARAGYKVVVPYQKDAWCYHDCGVSKLEHYDDYRRIMMGEYKEKFTETIKYSENKGGGYLELRESLVCMIEKRRYRQLEEIAEAAGDTWPMDTQIRDIFHLVQIYIAEKEERTTSSWLYEAKDWTQMYERYHWLRAVIRRIQFQRDDERIKELEEKIKNGDVSRAAVRQIASHSLESWENVRIGGGKME